MADKVPKDVLRFPDGEPIVVARPTNPTRTKSLALIAVRQQSQEAFQSAIDVPLTMLGFLVKRGGKHLAVDADGRNPVALEPGDVFAAPSDFYKPS